MKQVLISFKDKQVTVFDTQVKFSLLDTVTFDDRLVVLYTGFKERGTDFEVYASYYDPRTQCLSEIPVTLWQRIAEAIQTAPSKELSTILSHGIQLDFTADPDACQSVGHTRKPALLKFLLCMTSIALTALLTLADFFVFRGYGPLPEKYCAVLGVNIAALCLFLYPAMEQEWCFTETPFLKMICCHSLFLIEPIIVLLVSRLCLTL